MQNAKLPKWNIVFFIHINILGNRELKNKQGKRNSEERTKGSEEREKGKGKGGERKE